MQKYTITEEKLNKLISECISEVIEEAKNDESIGGWLGTQASNLGNWARKNMDDFRTARNQNSKNYNNGVSTQRYGAKQQTKTTNTAPATDTTAKANTAQATNQNNQVTMGQIGNLLQQVVTQFEQLKGAQQNDSGSVKTTTNASNPKQSIDQAAIAKAHGATRKPNRTVPTKKTPTPETPEQKEAGDAWENGDQYGGAVKGIWNESRKAQISENELSKMISESLKKFLKRKQK